VQDVNRNIASVANRAAARVIRGRTSHLPGAGCQVFHSAEILGIFQELPALRKQLKSLVLIGFSGISCSSTAIAKGPDEQLLAPELDPATAHDARPAP
jgi:hypothetical protein